MKPVDSPPSEYRETPADVLTRQHRNKLLRRARSGQSFGDMAAGDIAALSAAGYVIVPREPTERMLAAGYEAKKVDGPYDFDKDACSAIYRAMLAAEDEQ